MSDNPPGRGLIGWLKAAVWFMAGVTTVLLVRHLFPQKEQSLQRTTEPAPLASGVVRMGEATTGPGGVASAASAAGVPIEVIAKDAKKQGATVTGLGTTTVHNPGHTETGLGSTSSDPAPARPPQAATPPLSCPFVGTTERLKLNETWGNLAVPWGEARFSAAESKPWGYTVLPRTLQVANVLATRDDGSHAVYSHVTVDVDGKRYVLPIDDARWTEQLPESEWRWSFKAYLGAGAGWRLGVDGGSTFGASALLSLGSYGRTSVAPEWTLGLVGLGLTSERRPSLVVMPVAWNVGSALTLFDTLFVAPTYALDSAGQSAVMLSLAAKL